MLSSHHRRPAEHRPDPARRSPPSSLWIAALLSLVFLVGPHTPPPSSVSTSPAPGGTREPEPLRPGTRVERELVGGSHVFELALPADRLAEVEVLQRGVDVELQLEDAAGRSLLWIDSPTGDRGTERLQLLSAAPTTYRLRLEPAAPGAATGSYALTVSPLRRASPEDELRLAAQQAFAEAYELRHRLGSSDHRRILDGLERALSLRRKLRDARGELSALFEIGTLHIEQGRFIRAQQSVERALRLARQLGERNLEGALLNDLGRIYRRRRDHERAHDLLSRALAIGEEVGNAEMQRVALNNLASLEYSRGNNQAALDSYLRLLWLWRRAGDLRMVAFVLCNVGTVHLAYGQADKARAAFESALEHSAESGDETLRARALAGLGRARYHLGDHRRGLAALEQALETWRRVDNRYEEAVTLNDLGRLHAALGDERRAASSLETAERILADLDLRFDRAVVLMNVAWLANETGDARRAGDLFDTSLSLIEGLSAPEAQARALYGWARAAALQGRLEVALERVESALELVEALRQSSTTESLRIAFRASRQDYYDLYVATLFDLHRQDPAGGHDARLFQAIERARVQSLRERLIASGAGGDGSHSGRQEPGSSLGLGEPELVGRHGHLAAARNLAARIRAENPEVPGFLSQDPITLDQVQSQILEPETQLLVWHLGRERSFLLLVDRAEARVAELPARAEVEALALLGRNLLAAGRRRSVRTQARHVSAELSRLLFGPMAERIDAPRLLVMKSGALEYLPLAALPDPHPTAPSGSLLVERHEIVGLPSMSTLTLLRRERALRQAPEGTVAVVADPVYSLDDPRFGDRASRSPPPPAALDEHSPELPELQRLGGSRAEAAAILSLVPPERALAAVGFDANLETVRSGILAGYRIVHFATHGILDSESLARSGIVLSRYDPTGKERPGFLRAAEVYELDLPVELVVLSACDTALGRQARGEGVIGLTRGLIYAGASRVIVSLWEVDDRATTELMRRFYGHLIGEGRPAATSLHLAQREMRRQTLYREPYYWAAFVLQGDWT